MPSLSNVVGRFSRDIRTVDGRVIRGLIEPPKLVLRQYDGLFVPRAILKTGPKETVPLDAVLMDREGIRYLVLPLSEDNFLKDPTKKSYILFQVTNDMAWTRPNAPTVEPISGLNRNQPDVALGVIPAVLEFVSEKKDGTLLLTPVYKVLCNVDIQVGDSLDGKLIRVLSKNAGITYADVV